jgi:competence protein ComEA
MSRQSQEEVAAAARRRLELLGRELEQAGLRRVDADVEQPERADDLPGPALVEPAGRHLPPARPGPLRRTAAGLGGWVGDQVPATLRGRTRLEPTSVLLVVGLVAVAVAAAIVVVLRMDGDSEAVTAPSARPRAAGSASPLVPVASPGGVPSAGGSSGAGSVAGARGADVTVDVAGKVRRPGVATLPAGSRVADALRRAGGPRGRVDLSTLNLARVLVDGEQILVGRAGTPGGLAAGASAAAPDPVGSLVNLNTATAEQLDTLPGVGPVTAQKILEWRSAHGAFSSVDELLEVDGIGEKTLSDLAPHVTV